MTEPRASRDGGFTLIEIMVAFGILLTVAAALLPQLIVGIRSTETARLVSQAKGVAQGEIEHMRNLPWHVAPDTSDAEHEYYDVFDDYYPDVVAPAETPACGSSDDYNSPKESWTGYVADGDGRRCDYEPAGAMYRTVVHRSSPGFMVVIDTQFLTIAAGSTVLAPAAHYDTNGADNLPMSSRVGVTVTVLYSDRQTGKPISTYTELADEQVAHTRLEVAADGTAVDVVGTSPSDGAVSLTAGVLHLRGALANTSTVAATVAGVAAGLATGEQAVGAVGSVRVPAAPDAPNAITPTAGSGGLQASCVWVCWSDSSVVVPSGVSATDGRPVAGSAAAPLQAMLAGTSGFAFSDSGTAGYRTDLGLSGAIVKVTSPTSVGPSGIAAGCTGTAATGAGSLVSAAGYVQTSASAPAALSRAESCVVTRATNISLFPTGFAPDGVVQIELGSSRAGCVVSGASHVGVTSFGFHAVVQVHDATGGGYTQVAVIDSATAGTDPLDSVQLSRPVGGNHVLGDYVASWSSPTTGEIETSTSEGARVNLPGAITLSSPPLRAGTEAWETIDASTGDAVTVPDVDTASSITATFGAVSCSAQDAR